MDQNLFKHPVNFFSELHHQMSLDFKPINPEDELIASRLVNMLVLGKGGGNVMTSLFWLEVC